jgi:hypothetical protein
LRARDVGAEEYDVLAFDAVRSVLSYLERGEYVCDREKGENNNT